MYQLQCSVLEDFFFNAELANKHGNVNHSEKKAVTRKQF